MILGITQRMTLNESTGEYRDCLATDWYNFFNKLQYNWICLPNNPSIIINYVIAMNIDGLVLSGGDDIGIFADRDNTENLLLNWASQNKLPVIGVCRGFQYINHWLGGKLKPVNPEIHRAKRHQIIFSNNETREVNSYHNFSPVINDKMVAIAHCSEDNSIEAAFSGLMLGITWHPEREKDTNNADINLFKKHFEAKKR
jgi:putative glutamine amidotransferase